MPLYRFFFTVPDPKEILTRSHFLGRNSKKKHPVHWKKNVEIWSGDTDPLLTARQTGRE